MIAFIIRWLHIRKVRKELANSIPHRARLDPRLYEWNHLLNVKLPFKVSRAYRPVLQGKDNKGMRYDQVLREKKKTKQKNLTLRNSARTYRLLGRIKAQKKQYRELLREQAI